MRIRPTLKVPRKPHAGDLAGFATGLMGYVLFLNYIRYGSLKPWFDAKFLNNTDGVLSTSTVDGLTTTRVTNPGAPPASSTYWSTGAAQPR